MKTAWINRRFFSANLNLQLPTSWQQLTDKQLFYFAFLSAKYEPERAKSLFLLRLLQIQPTQQIGRGLFECRYKGRKILLNSNELALGLNQLAFLDRQQAVRPERLRDYTAVNALLQDNFTFFEYLRTETFFQMYLRTEKPQYLVRMANFLYRKADGSNADFRTLTDAEGATVLLWYVGAKQELAKAFPHYFRPAPAADADGGNAQQNIMDANDAQIRALTGGDVTKEAQVLQMQCWRCFAELNAKARESEELKKLYKK